MWAPFKAIPKPIKIKKESLIQFAKYRKKFRIEDAFTTYLDVYKKISIISETDEALIKQQVEENVKFLINEKILRKNGEFILINNQFK